MKLILTPAEYAAIRARPMKWLVDDCGGRIRDLVQQILDKEQGEGNWIVLHTREKHDGPSSCKCHCITVYGNSEYTSLCGKYLDSKVLSRKLAENDSAAIHQYETQFAAKITKQLVSSNEIYIHSTPQRVAIHPCCRLGKKYGFEAVLYARIRKDEEMQKDEINNREPEK